MGGTDTERSSFPKIRSSSYSPQLFFSNQNHLCSFRFIRISVCIGASEEEEEEWARCFFRFREENIRGEWDEKNWKFVGGKLGKISRVSPKWIVVDYHSKRENKVNWSFKD